MNRLVTVLSTALATAGFSHFAAAQAVTLEPGLYEYSNVINFGGLALPTDASVYCLKDGENSKTLEELADGLSGEGQCVLSNVNMTETTGRADFICTDTPLGMDIRGSLDAEFGSDFYDMDGQASIGPLGDVTVTSKARRLSECPANSPGAQPG